MPQHVLNNLFWLRNCFTDLFTDASMSRVQMLLHHLAPLSYTTDTGTQTCLWGDRDTDPDDADTPM